ncbi:hypothetical protein RUM43_009979 [Polyplax serrata]|uniref:Mitochondrial import receptor subunit TOM70 n=1 Tax=Polyplax serrata TaxID=468196 RepID=A0AAN8P874_POLSC
MAESGSSVSKYDMKWQVALAVGLPVAVGVGYWYFSRKGKKENMGALKGNSKNNVCGISIDGEKSAKNAREASVKKTPLELATELKEEGNKKFKNSKYEEAISSYNKAIELCPETETISLATFYQNKAAAYEQLQKYEDVKEACTKALSYNSKYTKALLRRAKACEHTKDLPQALEDVIAACILENFQSQSTLQSADHILKELGRQHAKEAMAKRVPIIPSNCFIKTYFMSFANDPLNTFLNKSDGDSSKGFLKAVDCFKKENYECIVAACTEEINFTEAEALYKNEALVLRGTFYHLMGENSAAMTDLDNVINNGEASPRLRANALIKRASIHMQLEDLQSCLNDFSGAVVVDEHNSDIYHHRSQINLILENIQQAVDDIKLSVSLNPKNPLTLVQQYFTEYRMAVVSKDNSAVFTMMKKLEQVLNDYPDCTECYALYAQVLMDQHEYQKADNIFQKAIRVDPKNAVLLVRRALLVLQSSADVEKGLKYIHQALELDNKCEFAYETLGTIEVQRGNLSKAIEMFDKAIALTKTELEMSHLFSLKDAAMAQKAVAEKMNMRLPRDVFNA